MKNLVFRELTEEEYVDFVTRQKTNNFLQSIFAFRRYKQEGREVHLLGVAREREREREREESLLLGLSLKLRKSIITSFFLARMARF